MSNNSAQQAADIVSPIADGALPNTVSPADARKAGRFGHDKPTPQNSIVLLIDHQIGLMAGVRDFGSLAEYKSNVVGLARVARALKIPTLSMLSDGYLVFPVIDACGAWNRHEAEAAMSRMGNAGAELVTTFALGCELQADWKLPSGNDMLAPFNHNLSEYGFVLQNFWNNANQHVVPDPFGMVR